MSTASHSALTQHGTILPNMTGLPDFITEITNRSFPLLTAYSAERVELNGTVLARWFAKIANLIGNELGIDLFTHTEPTHTPASFRISHELWTQVVWGIPLRAMGWTPLDDEAEPGPSDLLLTDRIDEAALRAVNAGAWVLAQPRHYLSFSWTDSPLPAGVLDALAETMTQADTVQVTPPPSAPTLEDIARLCGASMTGTSDSPPRSEAADCASTAAPIGPKRRLVIVKQDHASSGASSVIGECLQAWRDGSSVILVDSRIYTPQEVAQIAQSEGVFEGESSA